MPSRRLNLENESDESDQENGLFISGDREIEIDIASLYNSLCSNRMFNVRNQSVKKSVSVQTDIDTSDISPSWLLLWEMLVDELYTGLGNIINTMYHNPQSFNKEDAMRRANLNPAGMKYFKLRNGYWQSTLLPSIKIPDLVGTDEENRALCSDDTKRSLLRLLEAATKLRNLVPWASRGNEVTDREIPSCFSPSLKGEPSGVLRRSQSPVEDIKNDGIHNMDLDNLVKNGSDSGQSSACSPEYCNGTEPVIKRLRKNSDQEIASKKHVVLDDACGPDDIPGVKVSRYTPAPGACTIAQRSKLVQKLRQEDVNASNSRSAFCAEMKTCVTVPSGSKVFASCSNIRVAVGSHQYNKAGDATGKKSTRHDPHTCQGKFRGNREKNFIRKNIMDVKTKHLSSSHTCRNNSYNKEVPGTSQNSRHRTALAPLKEIHHKFLR